MKSDVVKYLGKTIAAIICEDDEGYGGGDYANFATVVFTDGTALFISEPEVCTKTDVKQYVKEFKASLEEQLKSTALQRSMLDSLEKITIETVPKATKKVVKRVAKKVDSY